jgi:GNAT superfamily N-acetyltransferase
MPDNVDSAMTIRVAQSEDLPMLLALYGHLHETDAPLPPAPELKAHCLAIVPNLTRGCRSYALIENVVTHADYRRRGFGTAIVKHAMELAWEAGCYKAMLLTGSRRPETHRFYQQCGLVANKTGFVASRLPRQ